MRRGGMVRRLVGGGCRRGGSVARSGQYHAQSNVLMASFTFVFQIKLISCPKDNFSFCILS